MRDLRVNGHKWSCTNPCRSEMYPNMCNCTSNPQWNYIKKDLADRINELTSIWMVGIKNRTYGHEHGIYKWTDANCSSKNLNINGKIIGPTVDKLIEMNRDSTDIITPKIIKNNDFDWKNRHCLDMYIDFETYNENLMDCDMDVNNSRSSNSIIFMIGVGMEIDGIFQHKSFIMEKQFSKRRTKSNTGIYRFCRSHYKLYAKK